MYALANLSSALEVRQIKPSATHDKSVLSKLTFQIKETRLFLCIFLSDSTRITVGNIKRTERTKQKLISKLLILTYVFPCPNLCIYCIYVFNYSMILSFTGKSKLPIHRFCLKEHENINRLAVYCTACVRTRSLEIKSLFRKSAVSYFCDWL